MTTLGIHIGTRKSKVVVLKEDGHYQSLLNIRTIEPRGFEPADGDSVTPLFDISDFPRSVFRDVDIISQDNWNDTIEVFLEGLFRRIHSVYDLRKIKGVGVAISSSAAPREVKSGGKSSNDLMDKIVPRLRAKFLLPPCIRFNVESAIAANYDREIPKVKHNSTTNIVIHVGWSESWWCEVPKTFFKKDSKLDPSAKFTARQAIDYKTSGGKTKIDTFENMTSSIGDWIDVGRNNVDSEIIAEVLDEALRLKLAPTKTDFSIAYNKLPENDHDVITDLPTHLVRLIFLNHYSRIVNIIFEKFGGKVRTFCSGDSFEYVKQFSVVKKDVEWLDKGAEDAIARGCARLAENQLESGEPIIPDNNSSSASFDVGAEVSVTQGETLLYYKTIRAIRTGQARPARFLYSISSQSLETPIENLQGQFPTQTITVKLRPGRGFKAKFKGNYAVTQEYVYPGTYEEIKVAISTDSDESYEIELRVGALVKKDQFNTTKTGIISDGVLQKIIRIPAK